MNKNKQASYKISNKGFPLFVVVVTGICSVVLLAFHAQFYQKQIVDTIPSYLLDPLIDECPQYYRGLQACIAFAALLLVSSLVGLVLVFFNKKFLCVLYAVFNTCFIIGLFASTLAYVIEPSDDNCDINDRIRTSIDKYGWTGDLVTQWKETYYGGMALAAAIIFFGSMASSAMVKHGQ